MATVINTSTSTSLTFSEFTLAKNDPVLYKEYLVRRNEIYNQEFEKLKKEMGPNPSPRRLETDKQIAQAVAKSKAAQEFSERAAKVGAATPATTSTNNNTRQQPSAPDSDPMSQIVNTSSNVTTTSPQNVSPNTRGIVAGKESANKRAIKQDLTNFTQKNDWRVRLSLASEADYLYKSTNEDDVGILWPLRETNGVIFPYTPQISISYAASYDSVDVAHTNYKLFQYKNSSVDNIQVTCEFTAQDTREAAYLLAVIHFFRSVTKMFYGQDKDPIRGVPPPLCYLHGLGQFQFDNHPLVVNSFTYQLPTDVDYIRTDSQKFVKSGSGSGISNSPGTNMRQDMNKGTSTESEATRVQSSGVPKNGVGNKVDWRRVNYDIPPTYVPTKISLSFSAYPIVTRNDISNNFSLRDYASGKLLQGSKRPGSKTGIW